MGGGLRPPRSFGAFERGVASDLLLSLASQMRDMLGSLTRNMAFSTAVYSQDLVSCELCSTTHNFNPTQAELLSVGHVLSAQITDITPAQQQVFGPPVFLSCPEHSNVARKCRFPELSHKNYSTEIVCGFTFSVAFVCLHIHDCSGLQLVPSFFTHPSQRESFVCRSAPLNFRFLLTK